MSEGGGAHHVKGGCHFPIFLSSVDLTWRDVQYLLVYTSNRNRLVDGAWITNGAGLRVSHKFGFGALDAEALVSRGRYWMSVPSQCSQNITLSTGTL